MFSDRIFMIQIQGISRNLKLVHFLQPKDLSMMNVIKILEQPIKQ